MDREKGGDLLRLAGQLGSRLTEWRRDFHRNPELGFKEFRTSDVVAEALQKLGVSVKRSSSGTGVVGFLDNGGTKTIALRADMDALPVLEKNDVPYRSQRDGVMHACGHDGHTAILLGAASLLAQVRDVFKGKVKFVFQAAEEVEEGGAIAMIREGVLEAPPVDGIIGLHLFNEFSAGSVGVTRGTVTAAVDNFEVEIAGKGGHAARPQETVDSIVIAGQMINAIQAMVSRETDALDPKVVTIGEIRGGTAPNVVAEKTQMRGTIRTLTVDSRNRICDLLVSRCKKIAELAGAEAMVQVKHLLPPQVNHPGLAQIVREAAIACLGQKRVIDYDRPSMGGEDFAFYSEVVPAVYFRLGIHDEKKGFIFPLHSSRFDFDESVLPVGTAVMAASAILALESDWRK